MDVISFVKIDTFNSINSTCNISHISSRIEELLHKDIKSTLKFTLIGNNCYPGADSDPFKIIEDIF